MKFITTIKTILEPYWTRPVYYLSAILVVMIVLFLSWILHRWLRQRRLSQGDELRSKIKETLTERPEGGRSCLEQNPRETAKIVMAILGNSGEDDREALLDYLGKINFGEILADLEIKSREGDYSLLVVTTALGLNEGWKTSISWLEKPGTWQWTASIHALSYWPGHNADQILVSEMASVSERYNVIDRAFNQPILGALSRRGKRSQELALDYLTFFSPPNLQLLFLMFFQEVGEIVPGIEKNLEERLKVLWKKANDEIKARILGVAAKHGLAGLVPLAKDAIGVEVGFVQLWAVRLLAKCSPTNSYLEKVKEGGSPRARREVDELQ